MKTHLNFLFKYDYHTCWFNESYKNKNKTCLDYCSQISTYVILLHLKRHKDENLYLKCKICALVWGRNMENNKGHVVKNPKIHQLLPTKNHEHPMVRRGQK